jgi:hypothetical protein
MDRSLPILSLLVFPLLLLLRQPPCVGRPFRAAAPGRREFSAMRRVIPDEEVLDFGEPNLANLVDVLERGGVDLGDWSSKQATILDCLPGLSLSHHRNAQPVNLLQCSRSTDQASRNRGAQVRNLRSARIGSSLDHLIRAQPHRPRYRDANQSRRFEVHGQRHPTERLHWQLLRAGSSENPLDVFC